MDWIKTALESVKSSRNRRHEPLRYTERYQNGVEEKESKATAAGAGKQTGQALSC